MSPRPAVLPLCALLGVLPASAACQQQVTVETIAIQSSTAWPRALRYQAPPADPGIILVVLHGDERTAVEAGLAVLSERGGRLVALDPAGERHIRFTLAEAAYRADPNRIFTDTGVRATLERSAAATPASAGALRAFADTLLLRTGIDSARIVVALHNNDDGNYGIGSYLPGRNFSPDAARVHANAGLDPDDFFFTTDSALFVALAERGVNVALQDNTHVTDDGSLSVLAGRRGQRYVNIEAEHGHHAEQVRMIRLLLDVFMQLEPAQAAAP